MIVEESEDKKEIRGYDPSEVPLGGRKPIYEEFCGCEEDADHSRDCGCGFGQCAKGLVY